MMPPHLKARIMEAAKAEASPTRQKARARTFIVLALALAVALPSTLIFSRTFVGVPRGPLLFIAGTAAGWLVVAIGVSWAAFARGRSMLGRSRALLVILFSLTPPLLFGWMYLWNLLYEETQTPVSGRAGYKCLAFTLAICAWPLIALSHVRRERDATHPGFAGAARGAAAGALGGFLVDLGCPVANPQHVALGHILPMLVLAVLGALAGHHYSGVRSR